MTSPASTPPAASRPAAAIGFILLAVSCISVNDMLIKLLSGAYPLHQMVFLRSAIGIVFTLGLVQVEGGFGILRTRRPWLHVMRGVLLVTSNMTYFTALAVLPLAEATALFFAAPLMITLLSVPLLGERVGALRLSAVAAGFVGVLIMLRPWEGAAREVPLWVQALPLLAALTYALNQIMTRKLGVASKASAMAVYIQLTFIVVSLGFFVVAGDGRFAEGARHESLVFLLRAWVMPEGGDRWLFLLLGVNATVIGYSLGQAYRLADAGTVAPFEYVGLPLAVVWGFVIWGSLPGPSVWAGILLILGGGLIVFLREQQKARAVSRRIMGHRDG
ncbi:DMT family transporter [Alphaproteobacteria bacterium KMM 3653]|uniref:DMT family transporter n=1 Tax=Harenicola maris TaxID=2841044 RepID=A0AAP2CQQ9_9RHOB|nr:DMT family transporter [Harenicola maris]